MNEQDLDRTLSAARRVGPEWGSEQHHRLGWAIRARGAVRAVSERRFGRQQVAVAAAAVLGFAAVMVVVLATADSRRQAALETRLADGTTIVADGSATVLSKTLEADHEVAFDLEAGSATFDVARRPSRTFRVRAGDVTVQVLGTRFRVQRLAAHARVVVTRGRVLVSWKGGSRELGVGEDGEFPPRAPVESAPSAANLAEAPAVLPEAAPGARAAPRAGHANTRAASADEPVALFERADRARQQGRPSLAIEYLRRIVDRHPEDPHAPMAAFIVGRLLLESLAQPAQAATAFEKARLLAHGGALGEDALAREVEALVAANDLRGARERAELYHRRYPNGSRLRAVTRLGGLKVDP